MGRVSELIDLEYNEWCRLLPSAICKISDIPNTNSISITDSTLKLSFLVSIWKEANSGCVGKVKEPDNFNGYLWEDCMPIFWGKDEPLQLADNFPCDE